MRRLLLLTASLLTAAPALAVTGPVVADAAPRPQGVVGAEFTDSLVAGGVAAPVALTGLPDGRALVLEKGGNVRVIQNGTMLGGSALFRSVCSDSERGLLGVAIDPNFGANGVVYLYYTRPSAGAPGGCVNRVSRFTMVGNTISSGSEVVLVDNIASPAGNHNGGDVAIGNDGYLYISVGDGGCDPRNDSGCAGANNAAQDRSLLNGKILRVDRATGVAAPGNPFTGPGTAACRTRGNTASTPTTWCNEIFAYGLRNPWRFAFDQNTGATRFYINDVGQGTREEVDLGILGANYGWPEREGQCAQGQNPLCPSPNPASGYTQPITDYQHGIGDYITGGAFVPNGAWDSAYNGGYLFADGDPGKIFFRNAAGNTNYNVPFATGVGSISDIGFVLEAGGWALYYVQPGAGQVRKIVYNTTPAPSPGDLAFVPVTPSQRVFDSRNLGAASGPLRAGSSRRVNVVGSPGQHRAALVNITLVRPGSSAFALAWQPATTRPPSSVINAPAGQITANSAIVPVDANGNVIIYVSATSHVLVDVQGFFDLNGATPQAGRFVPTTPVRAADTRQPANLTTNLYTRTQDGDFSVVNVPIEDHWGIGAATSAVALIVTGLSSGVGGDGYVVAFPHGGTVPTTSNVNTNGGADVRANLVIVPVGTDGSVDLRMLGTQQVLVDVVGSFTDGTAAASNLGTFHPIAPSRAVDTRQPFGFTRLAANGTGTANPTAVPDNALAVAQNLVMTATAGNGYLTAYPAVGNRPVVSNANATAAGQTRSAMAVTVLAGSGGEFIFSSVATDVIVDVVGYFNGPSA